MSGTEFVNVVYKTAWHSSTQVSVTAYGAVGDGKTDNSAAFQRALAAANTVLVPAGNFVLASPVYVTSNKSLVGTGVNSIVRPQLQYGFVVQGNNIVIQNIHFIGKLSSTQQYVEDQHFSSTMSKSALANATGLLTPATQATWSAPDANTLSLTTHGAVGSVTGPFYMNVAMTGLKPSARYYLHSSQNYIGGIGAVLPTFSVNGSTSYSPGNASGTTYFTGASSFDIRLGAARRWADNSTVTATFDLSALSLIRATNEMATVNTANVENSTYVYVENSTYVYFLNDTFELFDTAALKMNASSHVYIVGNTVKQSFGGITTQSGQNNFFVNNSIDNRFSDGAGGMLNHSFIRSHGIALSTTPYSSLRENNDQIVSNSIVGASWAIESPGAILYPNVSLNNIKAGQVGISLANQYGSISRNTIVLDGVSTMGIEIPTDGVNSSHDVSIVGNYVDMTASSLYNPGLSASNGSGAAGADLYNFQVLDNVIMAPIGFQFINVLQNAESSIVLTNNEVTDLGLSGFIQPVSGSDFQLSTDSAVKNNTFSCVGGIRFWGIDSTVPEASCP